MQNQTLTNDLSMVYNLSYANTEYRLSEDMIKNNCLLQGIETDLNAHQIVYKENYRQWTYKMIMKRIVVCIHAYKEH